MKKFFSPLSLLFISILIITCQEDPPPVPVEYTLDISVNPSDGGTVSPSSGKYLENKTVSISASAKPEYIFSGWTGSVVSAENPLSLLMDGNKNITANFSKVNYSLSITIEGEGTVEQSLENYESGSEVTLKAIPSDGWLFKEWKGDINSTDNPLVFVIENKTQLTLVFEQEAASVGSHDVVGFWSFNEYIQGGNSAYELDGPNNPYNGYDNHNLDECDENYLHSIIFNGNDTYTIYLGNYNIQGIYHIDSVLNTITFYDQDNENIGVISEINIDTISQNLDGYFDFPSLFDNMNGSGSQESDYDSSFTYIPDDKFEQHLIDKGLDDILDDYVKTTNIYDECCIGIDPPDICQIPPYCETEDFYDFDNRFEWRISNLSGIEAFPQLTYLNLVGNKIDSINLTKNLMLETFYANFNEFKSINTDYNPKLKIISIDNNIPSWDHDCFEGNINEEDTIIKLDFSKNFELESISIPTTGIISLDLSNNTKLNWINASNNRLSTLDFSSNTSIETIMLSNNNLSYINIDGISSLKVINLWGNQLTEINLSSNLSLTEIDLSSNLLSGVLDVSMFNDLSILRLSNNPNIQCIKVSEDQFTKLEAGELPSWSIDGHSYSTTCN